MYNVKGLVTRNTHMQYERSITSDMKDMAKVKVFVHVTDTDTDGRAMTYLLRLAKMYYPLLTMHVNQIRS